MNNKLTTIRPMQDDDLESVLQIIEEHDEDDAQEAQRDYQESGISGQYVLVYDNNVIGVTGAKRVTACDNTFKLSWTYVQKQNCAKGYGRQLMQHLLQEIKDCNGRKIFVYVSDYVDEDGIAIYAAALKLYQSVGFEIEFKIEDYYDKGESLTILGLAFRKTPTEQLSYNNESPKIVFQQLYPVAETENTFSFSWKTKLFGKSFTAEDVKIGTRAAVEEQASIVLISFPSNFINVTKPLFEAGFSQVGQLKDYYEDGIHEDHYAFRL